MHLQGEAALEWKRITKLLKARGTIAELDRAALAVYCAAWARLVEAETKLAETGGAVVKSPNGYPIQNPYLAVANTAAKQIQAALAEFGLSPVARQRLLNKADDDLDVDQLLARLVDDDEGDIGHGLSLLDVG